MSTAQDVMDAAYRAQQDAGPRPQRAPIDASTGTVINTPSPTLHSAIIRHIDGFNEATAPYLKPGEEAFDTARDAVQKVIDARKAVAQNSAWHPDKQLLEIADLALRMRAKSLKAFDSARNRMLQGLKALDESLNAPLREDANVSSTINTEVREHLKNLKSGERTKLLDQAMKDGDQVTLRACLSAPGYLSGLSETERKLRVHAYHVMSQPEVAQRASAMRRAVELIETNGPLVMPQIELALGGKGSWQKVEQARKRDTAARNALKTA